MSKIKFVVIVMLMLLVFVSLNQQTVYARLVEGSDASGNATGSSSGGSGKRDTTSSSTPGTSWWGQANSFLSGYQGESSVSKYFTGLTDLINLVKFVGNMVFVAVTVILGVKYIWGSVESKANVKESLVTLVVAAIVFYGWNTISALFKTGNNLSFVEVSAENTALNIYSTVLYIANFLAVGGIVYIGIRYMMAGAEGKAQLKAKGVPIVLGIIMVYATITFLNLIVSIV